MRDEEMEVLAKIKAEQYRESLFEKIVDLRDQGKSYRDISKVLGISVRDAWDMLHIPRSR